MTKNNALFYTLLLLSLLQVPVFQVLAQNIPVGTWRTHAAYNQAFSVARAGDKIYAGTSGGLFYYDLSFNNVQIVSKLDGLSETDISKLGYDTLSGNLLIAYANGNIDLLKDNAVKNLNFILQSQALTDKRLNHLLFAGKTAYLAYNFGVVVLDLQRQEIKETWRNLGAGGSEVAVYSSAVLKDSILLATSQGILAASQSANLQDFNSWKTLGTANGLPANRTTTSLAGNGTTLYAGIQNEGIFSYANGKFTQLSLSADFSTINNLQFSGNRLTVFLPNKILLQNPDGSFQTLTDALLASPQEMTTTSGKRWIADAINGLLLADNTGFQVILPGSPYRREVFRLYSYNENIVAVSGGYAGSTPASNKAGYYVFNEGEWKNYNKNQPQPAQKIPDVADLNAAVFNPADGNLYLASFGNGLLESKPDGTFEVFTNKNSTLLPAAGTTNSVRISGLAADADGNVWMCNFGVAAGQPSLHELKKDRTFQAYLPNSSLAAYATELLIDGNNYKWLLISPAFGGGIVVFDDKTGKTRYLTSGVGRGGLPDAQVNDLLLDTDGAVWAATAKGVAVYYNTYQIFETATDAILPVYEKNYLLRQEVATALALDGGNRKWIGTKSGIWLFSSDGTQLFNHFTTANSPLPSDNITSIALEPVTGEVFVATDKGMVSYRGTGTVSDGTNQDVKVFPNPVRPGFQGVVSISGLATNATVKITDASGRLVFQTVANGGTAVWNVQDYKSRRAMPGIYLIFSALPDGTQGFVGKIAVIE